MMYGIPLRKNMKLKFNTQSWKLGNLSWNLLNPSWKLMNWSKLWIQVENLWMNVKNHELMNWDPQILLCKFWSMTASLWHFDNCMQISSWRNETASCWTILATWTFYLTVDFLPLWFYSFSDWQLEIKNEIEWLLATKNKKLSHQFASFSCNLIHPTSSTTSLILN